MRFLRENGSVERPDLYKDPEGEIALGRRQTQLKHSLLHNFTRKKLFIKKALAIQAIANVFFIFAHYFL